MQLPANSRTRVAGTPAYEVRFPSVPTRSLEVRGSTSASSQAPFQGKETGARLQFVGIQGASTARQFPKPTVQEQRFLLGEQKTASRFFFTRVFNTRRMIWLAL